VTTPRDTVFSVLRGIRDEQARADDAPMTVEVWAVRTRNQLAAVYEAMRRGELQKECTAWEQLAVTAIARIEAILAAMAEDTDAPTPVSPTEEAHSE
jgi:hypothetical protein